MVSSPYETPGYTICHFVRDFVETPAGRIPVVHSGLTGPDWLGTLRARLGIFRNTYKVAPGIYSTGHPGPDSPVLVTANYKLSFDALRRHLGSVDAWIMVCDTRGINVWCAAGKGTFSSEEVADRAARCNLKQLVGHRRLILPQLAATGVSAQKVKQLSGLEVVWGPVRAEDIARFLEDGMKADESMRRVTFSLLDRLVLTPVELTLLAKPLIGVLAAVFLVSGFAPGFFSFHAAWVRGLYAAYAFVLGIFSGAVVMPLLLPWIPGLSFSLKGGIIGLVFAALLPKGLSGFEFSALMLIVMAVSSYLAMNFTGSTPFTSPSGVEKEMRIAIPLQAIAMLAAAVLWILTPFV
ncbi:MAG: hypothetical protein HY881_03610 [Deltaproteobacteria bacterium]|nr:hypothetical protein [Deltaproteobacteria bacterium]